MFCAFFLVWELCILFLKIFKYYLKNFFIQQVLIRHPFYTHQCIHVNPNLPVHHTPTPTPRRFTPLMSIRLFSTSVSQFLPCKSVHLYHFSRFHIYVLIYGICFSLSDLLHSVWQSLDPSTSQQMMQFRSFLWLSNIPLYICTTSSLSICLSMCQWTFRLLLCLVNSAAVNIGVHVSFWIKVFSSYMPRSGITGSYGNSIFRFLRNPRCLLIGKFISLRQRRVSAHSRCGRLAQPMTCVCWTSEWNHSK